MNIPGLHLHKKLIGFSSEQSLERGDEITECDGLMIAQIQKTKGGLQLGWRGLRHCEYARDNIVDIGEVTL